jgi:hypothetical protein
VRPAAVYSSRAGKATHIGVSDSQGGLMLRCAGCGQQFLKDACCPPVTMKAKTWYLLTERGVKEIATLPAAERRAAAAPWGGRPPWDVCRP